MTRDELAKTIGYLDYRGITEFVKAARSKHPELFGEQRRDSFEYYNFNKAEVECILEQIPILNELERELIVEMVEDGPRYIRFADPYIKGTQEFLKVYANDKYHHEVCTCCQYLMKKTWNGGKTPRRYPFCRFFNRFISKMKVQNKDGTLRKADIFKDKCDSWKRGELILFTKE